MEIHINGLGLRLTTYSRIGLQPEVVEEENCSYIYRKRAPEERNKSSWHTNGKLNVREIAQYAPKGPALNRHWG
jgi:hypothetical protein